MNSPITIKRTTISGFRAYLYPQEFNSRRGSKPLSLAIFAPNGKGKSSFVDALEFYLSKDATVERLGERKSATRAGREALAHFQAELRNIPASVKVEFHQNNELFGDERKTGDLAPSESIHRLLKETKVSFIIRGHELRRFVEEKSPQDRYEELSRWFGFSPLLATQDALRELKLAVGKKISDDSATLQFNRQIGQISISAVPVWNKENALTWFNETFLANLDEKLVIDDFSQDTSAYQTLSQRRQEEERKVGLPAFQAVSNVAAEIFLEKTEAAEERGVLIQAIAAKAKLDCQKIELERVKSESSKAIFADIWNAAETFLGNVNHSIDHCPVCETPFENSPHNSRDKVLLHVKTELGLLKAYKDALAALDKANKELQHSTKLLSDKLTSLNTAIGVAGFEVERDYFSGISTKIGSLITDATNPELVDFKKNLRKLSTESARKLLELSASQRTITYGSALNKLNALIEIHKNVEKNIAEKSVLVAIQNNLQTQIGCVDQHIKQYVQTLIDSLREKINFFYREIQAGVGQVPEIFLKLPESAAVQQQINLLIDFSDNRKSVVPGGYLSDSQIHTLALSIRLASICLFNERVPVIVLDDVVTSYDTDRRKAIVSMVANHLALHQVFIFTHDEQFFNLLQEHLPPDSWGFRRITKIDPDFGPKYSDHKIRDEEIDQLLAKEEPTANLIRQAEEDWLLSVCRGFGVDLRIREINKPYEFNRSELAMALHRFLADKKITPPTITGTKNPFLLSLQKGTVENFGSHFSDNPNASSSSGDEKARWGEFKAFRGHFVCANSACNKNGFHRPFGLDKPVCKTCQTPFGFK